MSRRHALAMPFLDALVDAKVSALAMRCAIIIGGAQTTSPNVWTSASDLARMLGCDIVSAQRAVAELRGADLLDLVERDARGSLYALRPPRAAVRSGASS